MEPLKTPIESPQSNDMAKAFDRTLKRDYVSVSHCPNAQIVIAQMPQRCEHYNTVQPHGAGSDANLAVANAPPSGVNQREEVTSRT